MKEWINYIDHKLSLVYDISNFFLRNEIETYDLAIRIKKIQRNPAIIVHHILDNRSIWAL